MTEHADSGSWFDSLRASMRSGELRRVGDSVSRGLSERLLPAEGEPWVSGEPAEEPLLEFDFSGWPSTARLMLEHELQGRNMEHLWRGGHLLVPSRLEHSVDDLLDELAAASMRPEGESDVRWCPSCGSEFIASVDECPDCLVALTDERPTPTLVGSVVTAQIDLSGWADATRLAFAHQIAGGWPVFDTGMTAISVVVGTASYHNPLPAALPHAWDGAILVVRQADEEIIRAWVEATDATMALALDPDADKLAYDVDDMSDEDLTSLLRQLVADSIPHELSADGELFVHEEDEGAIEAILDRIDFPDELPVQDESELENPDDGLVAQEILSDLFEATDRLVNDTRNADAVLHTVEGAERLAALPLPFGFDRAEWQGIVQRAEELKSLVEAARPDLDHVEEQARALRDVLHRLV